MPNEKQNLLNLLDKVEDKPITIVSQLKFPMVEEMSFRAIINSTEEGLKLLRAVQIMVNELGCGTIVQLMDKLESKPQLMQQAKSYLPYLLKL